VHSANSDSLDVSYSIQGESVVITWEDVAKASKYAIMSGSEIDETGSITYELLQEFTHRGQFQWNYEDESIKPKAIVYYKIVAMDSNGQKIMETDFSANFINKANYTVNIIPNYFSRVLDVEINTNTSGLASISVEDLTGNLQINSEQPLEEGYNSFSLNVAKANATRLIVKVDYNDKIIYRLVELEDGNNAPIITSDE
jgi:hypothetical protein